MSRVLAGLIVVALGASLCSVARAQDSIPGGWSGEVEYRSFGFAAPSAVVEPTVVGGLNMPGMMIPNFGIPTVGGGPNFGGFPGGSSIPTPGFSTMPQTINGTGTLFHAVRRTTARRRRS